MKHLSVWSFLLLSTFVARADPGHPDLAPGAAVTQRIVTGCGEWSFATVPGWGMVPTNQPPGPTHGGVVVDKAGFIYVSTDGRNGIVVYKPDGSFDRTMATQYAGIHSLALNEESGEQFIYAAFLKGNQALKLKRDGSLVWKIEVPMESGLYKEAKQFKPTSVTVAPDGAIFVADGYGASVIHKFDADRKYLKTFGGADAGPGRFKTCHGIAVDTRGGTPSLLVCDRANRRISRFDFDGNFLAVVTEGLRLPCAMSIRGDCIAVAELEGRVAILDKDNKVSAVLGDNPETKQRANYGVPPTQWVEGIFTAPHGICWAADGTIYVQDWNSTGKLTKLAQVK